MFGFGVKIMKKEVKATERIMDAFLRLCANNQIEAITVKNICDVAGISKQAFYNHYQDKYDLICHIYDERIISEFDINRSMDGFNYKENLQKTLNSMKEYKAFLKKAVCMECQNNLREYMEQHSRDFDIAWHQSIYGTQVMPEELRFAIVYHAAAVTSVVLFWIMSDMRSEPEELANLIVQIRSIGMESILDGRDKDYLYK